MNSHFFRRYHIIETFLVIKLSKLEVRVEFRQRKFSAIILKYCDSSSSTSRLLRILFDIDPKYYAPPNLQRFYFLEHLHFSLHIYFLQAFAHVPYVCTSQFKTLHRIYVRTNLRLVEVVVRRNIENFAFHLI